MVPSDVTKVIDYYSYPCSKQEAIVDDECFNHLIHLLMICVEHRPEECRVSPGLSMSEIQIYHAVKECGSRDIA